ncbi:MAG: D-alanine-D-alanine ligase [Candidatus Nomurabacteria bacterium GW2011_GWA2_40_9]|uniref:D-alanine--D-alanine ligase n=1 Tax=Candidatus Nomurabacteria bacterium GW2011_GWA2_40_9 TaxID=1618734 RepID=A0A0G0WUK2_9BACT|nr:MAG: D-alanine-D-alanine ligase [Candidatus Nomurabacteria bacterium GW2011_GWA2_40_9]
MVKNKLKIGVLFGGKSAEHEVSLNSAKNIISALDKNKYEITPIKINKNGEFNFLKLKNFDVIFPVLHGPYGEDGSMQGFLKLLSVPFVGASVLGSAVGMDKDVMKRLLNEAGIKNAKCIVLRNREEISFNNVKKSLGLPMFVKPANLGSSVGVSKVKNEKEWNIAIKEAFQYDNKIIVEEMIVGRELECAVLGNEKPIASLIGEVVLNAEFYSYDAKYIDDDGAVIEIPAKNLLKTEIKKLQNIALKAYQTLNCEGMGRVDMFMKKNGEIYVNEINTIPGFTNISMYPKLWEISGINKTHLLNELISLAIERHKKENKLKN